MKDPWRLHAEGVGRGAHTRVSDCGGTQSSLIRIETREPRTSTSFVLPQCRRSASKYDVSFSQRQGIIVSASSRFTYEENTRV